MSTFGNINLNSPPPFASDAAGSGSAKTGSWGDNGALMNPGSNGMAHCAQFNMTAPFWVPSNSLPLPTAQPNDPSNIPGFGNEVPTKGYPTPNTTVPYRPNDNLHQTEHTSDPSTALELLDPRPPRPYSHFQPAQRELLDCLIPGCSKQFCRSDSLGNHLRRKHRLPIPKRRWATIWISSAENYHHYVEAVVAQARANCIA